MDEGYFPEECCQAATDAEVLMSGDLRATPQLFSFVVFCKLTIAQLRGGLSKPKVTTREVCPGACMVLCAVVVVRDAMYVNIIPYTLGMWGSKMRVGF